MITIDVLNTKNGTFRIECLGKNSYNITFVTQFQRNVLEKEINHVQLGIKLAEIVISCEKILNTKIN